MTKRNGPSRERRLGGYDAVLKHISSQLSLGMTTSLSSFSILSVRIIDRLRIKITATPLVINCH